jgi:hypothetical protein
MNERERERERESGIQGCIIKAVILPSSFHECVCVSWCFAWNLAAAPDISKVVSTYSRHKKVCVCHTVWVHGSQVLT